MEFLSALTLPSLRTPRPAESPCSHWINCDGASKFAHDKLQILIAIGAGLLIASCSLPDSGSGASDGDFDATARIEVTLVHDLLERLYLWPEQVPDLTEVDSMAALLAPLTDPFTTYYPPVEAAIRIEDQTHPPARGTTGLWLRQLPVEPGQPRPVPDTLEVWRVLPASPADSAGFRPHDRLLALDGLRLDADTSLAAWWQLADDTVGSSLELEVLRDGAPFLDTLHLATVPLPTVYTDSLAPDLSLIQLTEFRNVTISTDPGHGDTTGSWAEFRNALRQTAGDAVTLLDLRGNPGGNIRICLGMADELVASGVLLRMEDRSASYQPEISGIQLVEATPGGLGESRQFILLADAHSASCSEIFVAAIRANRSDPLIGQTTYGKGIGQSQWRTPGGGLLKVTSIRLSDAHGDTWHQVGITPDEAIVGSTEQLAEALVLAHGVLVARTTSATGTTRAISATNGASADARTRTLQAGTEARLRWNVGSPLAEAELLDPLWFRE